MRRLLPALLLLGASSAQAGDLIDTTITFLASDDNLFAGAGETTPSSPRFDARPRKGNNLFFDNYNTRDTGEETRSHLVLYRAFDGYFGRLLPEAAMVIELDLNRTARDIDRFEQTGGRRPPGGLRDDGSYLALRYRLGGTPQPFPGASGETGRPQEISVVLFPFDSDRFRLGYSWELTWGGRSNFILGREVPGVKVSYDATQWYGYLGFKTARTQAFTREPTDAASDENESVYGVLAGAGVHASRHLLLETNGGFFEKGTIPIDRGTLQGTSINQTGASVQITWHDGIDPSSPIDTRLYRNVGEDRPYRSFSPKPFSYLISGEATVTSQVLENAEALGSTTRETGFAGDVNVVTWLDRWTFRLDAVTRSLQFLVQDTPGLLPFSTVPKRLATRPEFFVAAGADYHIESLRLVPALTVGVQFPAVAKVDAVDAVGRIQETAIVIRKTKNVLGQTTVESMPLPSGEEVLPVFSAKLNLKQELSTLVSLIAEAQLTLNNNLVVNDPAAGARVFENPYILGASLIAQARF